MTIAATYIGQSTVQISTSFSTGQDSSLFTTFDTFKNCVKDAMLGSQPNAAGANSGVIFTAATGITAQTTSGWTLLDEFWGGISGWQTLGTVSTTGTAGQFSASTSYVPLFVGQKVIITGTAGGTGSISGYTSGTTYYVIASASTSTTITFTLSATKGGSAITTVAGTITGLTFLCENGASPTYTQVFKALNNDGKSSKNIIIRYKTDVQEVYVSTCEEWLVSTHIPYNEVFDFYNCCPINYNLTSCDFIIMVNPRWCLLHSYICNESTRWAAVVETEREAFEDIVSDGFPYTKPATGTPNWGLVNSVIPNIGVTTIGSGPIHNTRQPLISVPRTKTGYTALNAATKWSADYGVAQYPNWTQGEGTASMSYQMGNANQKFTATGWDTTKRVIVPIKPIHDFTANIINIGMIHGLKTLNPVGTNMNKVSLKVDSNGNASQIGAEKPHWLLNLTSIPLNSSIGAYGASNTYTSQKAGTVTDAIRVPKKFVSVGNKVYILHSGGLHTYNITSKGETRIFGTGGAFGVSGTDYTTLTDMYFDGERYLYVTDSTSTKALTRLDTLDDTTSVTYATSIASGFSGVLVNGNTVLCMQNTATTPKWYRFIKQAATGTVNAITDGTNTPIGASITASPAAITYGVGVDSDGNFYMQSLKGANAVLGKLAFGGNTAIAVTAMFGNPSYTTSTRCLISLFGLDYVIHARNANAASACAVVVQKCSTNTTLYNAASSFVETTNEASGTLPTNELIYVNGKFIFTNANQGLASSTYQGDRAFHIANCEISGAVVQEVRVGMDQTTNLPINQYGATYSNQCFYFDGARIYQGSPTSANSSNGFKVIDNVNGGKITGGVFGNGTTLAQMAIPS